MVIGKEWRRRVQRVGKGRGGEHGGGLTVVSPLPHGSKEGQWRCHLCLTEQWKGRGNGRRGGRGDDGERKGILGITKIRSSILEK
ncbi:hypothetical protein BHE74_00027965 [Ensete ventricosum]|nr:hypothetical protein BHE74_00027965 [Ensete ventricosum]